MRQSLLLLFASVYYTVEKLSVERRKLFDKRHFYSMLLKYELFISSGLRGQDMRHLAVIGALWRAKELSDQSEQGARPRECHLDDQIQRVREGATHEQRAWGFSFSLQLPLYRPGFSTPPNPGATSMTSSVDFTKTGK